MTRQDFKLYLVVIVCVSAVIFFMWNDLHWWGFLIVPLVLAAGIAGAYLLDKWIDK